MDRSEIEALLRKTFSSGQPPTGDKLVKLQGHTDTRLKIRNVFSGRRWWELDADILVANDDAIPFLEPEGLRYYLPAYLIAILNVDRGLFFSEMVIYNLYLPLDRPEGDPVRTKFEQFLGLLSTEEKRVIKKFLEYLVENDPSDAAEEAVRLVWHKY